MRFYLSLSLAAALAVASVVPATAGSFASPAIEGPVESEVMVAVEPVGSLGSTGIIGIVALLLLAAAATSSSTTGSTSGT